MQTRPNLRRLAAALAVALLALSSGLIPGTSGAQPPAPTEPPSEPTVLGARWLAAQLTPDGYVEGLFAPGPDVDATRDVAFALAATGLEPEAFNRALGWITANIEEVIAPEDEPDGAGTLGYLIMLALAVGEDPRSFGGVDLIARLEATYGRYEDGLYGEADPTFDGVLRQSLALLAFDAANVAPWPEAIFWLQAQQCTAVGDPASAGGFPNYRSPATPCPAPSVSTYSGAETDATSVALQYFARTEGTDAERVVTAAAFLRSVQSAGGGFPWYAGDVDSPNSTALAIGGLIAAGEGDAARAAIDWLVAQQLGCDSPDAGAFTSSYSDGGADQFASRQAVLGVAGASLPIGATSWQAATDPCAEPGPGPDPDPQPEPDPGVVPIAAPATPRFTG